MTSTKIFATLLISLLPTIGLSAEVGTVTTETIYAFRCDSPRPETSDLTEQMAWATTQDACFNHDPLTKKDRDLSAKAFNMFIKFYACDQSNARSRGTAFVENEGIPITTNGVLVRIKLPSNEFLNMYLEEIWKNKLTCAELGGPSQTRRSYLKKTR